jgi:hypothetical protein
MAGKTKASAEALSIPEFPSAAFVIRFENWISGLKVTVSMAHVAKNKFSKKKRDRKIHDTFKQYEVRKNV